RPRRPRRAGGRRVSARDVVVVGAGPVGLTAALAVRALGRPVTVIEAGGAPRGPPRPPAGLPHNAPPPPPAPVGPRTGARLPPPGPGVPAPPHVLPRPAGLREELRPAPDRRAARGYEPAPGRDRADPARRVPAQRRRIPLGRRSRGGTGRARRGAARAR